MEDFKHNNEGTIAGIDRQNLLQVARKKRCEKDERLYSKGLGGGEVSICRNDALLVILKK